MRLTISALFGNFIKAEEGGWGTINIFKIYLPAGVMVQSFAQLINIINSFTSSHHFKDLPGKEGYVMIMIISFKQKKEIIIVMGLLVP